MENKAELKGVLDIKPPVLSGSWHAIADPNCLEELGSPLKIQSVNEISFWTGTISSISKTTHYVAQQIETGSEVIPNDRCVRPRTHMLLLLNEIM